MSAKIEAKKLKNLILIIRRNKLQGKSLWANRGKSTISKAQKPFRSLESDEKMPNLYKYIEFSERINNCYTCKASTYLTSFRKRVSKVLINPR